MGIPNFPVIRICSTLLIAVAGSCCAPGGAPAPTTPTGVRPSPGPAVPDPALRRTIIGQVREVNGSAVSDVAIKGWSLGPGAPLALGRTAADGTFRLDQFGFDGLVFEPSGYEPGGWAVPKNAKPDETFTITVKLQPVLRLSWDSTIASVLTPDDLTYSSEGGGGDTELWWGGDVLCGPCKLIRVLSAPQGGGTLGLSWSGGAPLTVWAGDWYSGPVAIAAAEPGESKLTVAIQAARGINTVLVGFDRNRVDARTSAGMVSFQLTLEAPQSTQLLRTNPGGSR